MSDKNPWSRLSRRQIYDNPWMTVVEDQVINPNGGEGLYGVVQFKNLAIGILPVSADNEIWLVGQYRYAVDQYSWEIPSGGHPLDEDPLNGAKRELQEETGLTASDWSVLTRLHTSNSITDEAGIIYLAQDLEPGEPNFDETEDLQIKQLPYTTALDMVMQGEITDAITMIALLKFNQMNSA